MNPVWHDICVTLAQHFLDSTKSMELRDGEASEWAMQFIHEKELSGNFGRLVRQVGKSVRVYGVRITVEIEPENETWNEFNMRMDKHPELIRRQNENN